jgi:hypothetical protein
MAAAGLGTVAAWLSRAGSMERDTRPILVFLTPIIAAIFLLYSAMRYAPDDDAPEHRAAGVWLRRHFGGESDGGPARGVVVMSRKPWVAYYAQGLIAELPDSSIEDVMDRARRKNAEILVIDERFVAKYRRQLAPLLDPTVAPLPLHVLYRTEQPRRILLYDLRGLRGQDMRSSDSTGSGRSHAAADGATTGAGSAAK